MKHWCAATRENVCEIPAVCLCSSCVLLFQTGSAVLSVAFDLSFLPASCWFDKIDDDHYCVQALPPSSIFSLIYSIKASNVSFVAVCAFGFKGLIWRNMGKIKEIAEHGIL